MKFPRLTCAVAALALSGSVACGLDGDPYANETSAQRDARMGWWREAKFGMFIHWGVYAVPAGTYQGKSAKHEGGEWILHNLKIPLQEYRGLAKDFTADHYDPKAWAALAKEAGMRYMVITAKHHDGFALFPSDVTDWDVAHATPHTKDLIGPLAEAARGEGLKFGLYYSQAQDWMHPGGAIYGFQEGTEWDPSHKGSFDHYLDQVAVPQVKEILTRYQPDVLWWDTPCLMTQPRAQKLAKLLSLKPGIIHNNRLGGGYQGDTETPEQFVPPTGFPGRDWETCMTMNDTWGFRADDHDWKSFPTILTTLIDVASKGGNYLLNIGPDASGRIPQESVDLLKQMGAWMKVNGESIYGTHASPFKRLPWGRCTVKPAGKETILYLHVLDWDPAVGLLLPGLKNEVKSAVVLSSGAELAVRKTDHGPEIMLKGDAPDPVASTLKIRIQGTPEVQPVPVRADADGVIRLTPLDATLHGKALQLTEHDNVPLITKWENPEDTVSWEVEVAREGTYTIQLIAAAKETGSVIRVEGLGKFACPVAKTETMKVVKANPVGEVTLKRGQKFAIQLQPVADGWKPVNLASVELVPGP